jgi:hypothetical protein
MLLTKLLTLAAALTLALCSTFSAGCTVNAPNQTPNWVHLAFQDPRQPLSKGPAPGSFRFQSDLIDFEITGIPSRTTIRTGFYQGEKQVWFEVNIHGGGKVYVYADATGTCEGMRGLPNPGQVDSIRYLTAFH